MDLPLQRGHLGGTGDRVDAACRCGLSKPTTATRGGDPVGCGDVLAARQSSVDSTVVRRPNGVGCPAAACLAESGPRARRSRRPQPGHRDRRGHPLAGTHGARALSLADIRITAAAAVCAELPGLLRHRYVAEVAPLATGAE